MSAIGTVILILILAAGVVALLMLYLSPSSTPLYTENSDSSNPGYPFSLLDAPGNFWDSLKWWQKVLAVCLAVVLCTFVGGMAAGILTGIPK